MNSETLLDVIENRSKEMPDSIAYTFLADGEDHEENITYSQLFQKVKSLAVELQNNFQQGDRALLLFEPGLDFIISFYACLFACVIAVPAYPPDINRLNKSLPRLLTIIKDSQPKVILTSSDIMEFVKGLSNTFPVMKELKWLAVDKIDVEKSVLYKTTDIKPETIAFLQYTSGSTASPKGVVLTHENIIYNQKMIMIDCENDQGNEPKTFVGWLPLYHDMGLIGNVIQPLYIGSRCILMSPLHFLQKPFRWLKAITKYKSYTSGGPNFSYDLCTQKITESEKETLDLSSWKIAFNGAEPIRNSSLANFFTKFESCGLKKETIYPCYGLAEATLIVSGGSKKEEYKSLKVNKSELEHNNILLTEDIENSKILVSSGKAILEQDIKIVNTGDLTECNDKTVGEIWINGKNVAQGYWNNPQKTDETFKAEIKGQEGKHYLRTGDLGFLYENELFVTGRIKDMIIINGRNIYPHDIEKTIELQRKDFPEIRLGCITAFGVEVEEKENLVIMLEISPDKNSNFNREKLINSISHNIFGEFEIAVHSVILIKPGQLPKTSSGKLQRSLCKKAFLNNFDSKYGIEIIYQYKKTEIFLIKEEKTEFSIEYHELQKWISDWFINRLKLKTETININQSLIDFGIDSSIAVMFATELEIKTEKILNQKLLYEYPTIREILNLIGVK